MSKKFQYFRFLVEAFVSVISRIFGFYGVKLLATLSETIPPKFHIDTRRGRVFFVAEGRSGEWRGRTLLTKEPETIEWIDTFLSGSVFLDVGANIGSYSLYAALDESIQVYGVEPSYKTIGMFFSNICANKMGERVHPIAAGLGLEKGIFALNMHQINGGEAGHALDANIVFKGQEKKVNFKQSVFGMSLDELILDFKIPIPNYIKIDVDGTEDRIIAGSKNTLSSKELKSLLIEFDDINFAMQLTPIILSYGFSVRKRLTNPNSGNVIFDRD